MTTLRIFVHDVDLQFDGLSLEWVLFSTTGQVIRRGSDALNELPIADKTEVVIPADWVSFTQAILPAGNRKRVLEALPYLIEDHLMASPETVHVVLTESLTSKKTSSSSTMLASIDKLKLSDVLKHLKHHGIIPNRLLPATVITDFTPNSWCLVCDNEDFFVRTGQNNGFALTLDDENKIQQIPPLALQLAIKQSKSTQSAPKEIFVYGNVVDKNKQLDLAQWSSNLGIPFVEKRNDWRCTPPLASNIMSGITSMNFLQGQFEPINQGWAALSQAKPTLWLASLIILISLIGSGLDWVHKSLQKNGLDQEMKILFMRTFPDAKNVVDAPLQMQRKLTELQHASGENESNDFLPLLAKLSERSGGLANVSAIDYVANQLTLSLQANSEETARGLIQKISVPGQIISIQNLKTTNNVVTYQLVLKAIQ